MFVKSNKTKGECDSTSLFPFVLAAFLNLSAGETVLCLLGVCVCTICCVCSMCAYVHLVMCKSVLGFECVMHVCVCVFSPLIVCEIVNPDPQRFTVRPTEKKKKPHC